MNFDRFLTFEMRMSSRNLKKNERKNKNKLYIRCYIIKKIKNINKKLEKLKKDCRYNVI